MAAMMNTIIYANLLPFVSLIIFLVFILHNPVFDKRQARLFLISGAITLFMIVIASLDYIFFRWEYLNEIVPSIYLLRRITSFINFALSPVIPMIIIHIYAAKKPNRVLYIPALLNFVLCFASVFVNVIFFISTNNSYDRGPLFFIPFLTTIFYLGALIAQRTHAYTKSKKAERLFLFLVVCLLGGCMYLEISQYFLFLSWDFTAFFLILYYLLLNIHRTIIDPLTTTYNRLAYNKELEKISRTTPSIIALIDINDFKDVNDQLGHDVGDVYLQKFAILLEHSFTSIGNIYRIGGDEFVLLAKKTSDSKFLECLGHAKRTAKEENISFACGWGKYSIDKDINEFIIEVDQLMYANKREVKENI